MKDYKKAYEAIQEVKVLIAGRTYDEACERLCGYNIDGDICFDYDYENITGTVWNNKGKAKIHGDSTYDIIDDDFEKAEIPIEYNVTESELKEKARTKVYLVYGSYWTSTNENPESDLLGVFSSKEKAQKVCDIWKNNSCCYAEGLSIEELTLDDPELPIGYKGGF